MNIKKQIERQIHLIKKRILLKIRLRIKPKVVVLNGIKLPIANTFSKNVLASLYSGDYENTECQFVKNHIRSDDVVMELGTGIGYISSFCARKIGSNRIITYEANPTLENHIRHTYALNNVSPNLHLSILGDKEGSKSFFLSDNFWSSSIIQRQSNDVEIQMPMKSFNHELRKNNPTFLIIDIEGGEFDLFHYIEFYNVEKILIEIHVNIIGKEKADFVCSALRAAGFKLISQVRQVSMFSR